MKKIVTTVLAAAVAVAIFFAGRGCGRNADGVGGYGGDGGDVVTRVDTVVVRDTLRDTVLVPVERRIVRVDTVWLRVSHDTARAMGGAKIADSRQADGTLKATDSARVEVPVERKVYTTRDYRAVVEGFRPALVEMELYPTTTFVTRGTIRAKAPERWGIGLQAGWGISPKGVSPYLGVGVQYRISAW